MWRANTQCIGSIAFFPGNWKNRWDSLFLMLASEKTSGHMRILEQLSTCIHNYETSVNVVYCACNILARQAWISVTSNFLALGVV